MKRFLLLPFLFFVTVAHAKNYYISASGSDSNNGLTIATPWQSITKVNAAVFVTGDSILFKTGDNFYGTLTPTAGGITIGAYGAGAKPVITGLTTISSWTSIGANIWEAVVPGGLSTLNMVVINGVLTPMGRWPNANTANSGYATYESSVVNVSLTDLQLTASPNWTGGEVVFRRRNYTSDRAKITNHTGNTIAFSTYAGADMIPGYGYFVENHLSTLDQNGEWYYDPVTKKIKIYFTTTPPSIQVATLTNLVKLVFSSGTGVKSNITIKDISFKGCEGVMMNILWSNNLIVDNCNFSFAGINAIEYNCVNYLTIKNSTISDINMIGIQENASTVNTNVTIQNNVIRRIGINAGMISNAYGEGCSSIGVNVGSPNLLVKENVLDSIGYNGISLKANRNNQIVRKNIITNFCSVKNEGGAIYNSGLRGDPAASNIIIDSNFISKGVGALGGTTDIYNKRASAIFMDATSYGVNILNNTIFDTWDGIGISQVQNIVIKGNTIYNTGNSQPKLNLFSTALLILDAVDGYQHVRANTITNNIFFSKYPDQLMYYQTDRYNGVGSAGVIDYNYYANPWTDFPTHRTNTTAASVINLYSLKMWQSAFPVYDVHSKGSPVSFPLNTVTTTGANKSTNETFNSNTTGWVASSSPVVHTLTWDNTSQITGTGSAKLTSSVSGTNFTSFYNVIGAVDAAKKYVLRFKTKASKLGTFNTYLQQWNGSYAIITSAQSGTIGTDIEQHEIIFSGEHSTQTNAAVFIQFSQNASDVYIDDVQFYEATVIPTNVDDYIRFEYNPTNSAKVITLDAKYIGVDSTVYNGSITLQPYSSAVLLKSGLVTSTLKVDAGTDISLIMPTNTATLKGTATEPVTNYQWTKIAGPGQYTIANPNNPSTAISNLAMGKYTFQLKVINSAGDSAMATINVVMLGILPVTLIDFTAKTGNDKITLQWKVASEINFSHYAIERSGNNQIFENIGQVNANNLFTVQDNYAFDDNFPLQGINYYRLVMIDKDGTTKYSKVISVTENNVSSFKLSKLSLSSKNNSLKIAINSNYQQIMQVVLVDVSGRILYKNPIQLQKGFNNIDKKIPALNTGVYYAKLFTGDQIISKALLSEQ